MSRERRIDFCGFFERQWRGCKCGQSLGNSAPFFFWGGDAEKGRDFVSFLFNNLSSEKGHTGNENCFIQPFVLWWSLCIGTDHHLPREQTYCTFWKGNIIFQKLCFFRNKKGVNDQSWASEVSCSGCRRFFWLSGDVRNNTVEYYSHTSSQKCRSTLLIWNLWFHAVFQSLENFVRLHVSGAIKLLIT